MQTAYARFVYDQHTRGRRDREARTTSSNFTQILKDACRRLVAFLFTQIGVCGLVVAYNIIGAFVFNAIEGQTKDARLEAAMTLQGQTVRRLWNVTLQLNVLHEAEWRREVVVLLRSHQDGVVPLIKKGYQGLKPEEAWSFSAALMYSLSVYTTIGYGNLTPRTDMGKLTTIAYAIVGMPLMLLYMANLGEILANTLKFLFFKACRCDLGSVGYYRSSSGTLRPNAGGATRGGGGGGGGGGSSSVRDRKNPEGLARGRSFQHNKSTKVIVGAFGGDRKTIPITWCLIILAVYVLAGGIVFAHWEGWSVLDGCYFCYVSLATIGYGDLVPGRSVVSNSEDSEVEYKQVLCTVYLLVGMALVAMCFNLMQEEAIEDIKTFWRNLGCMRKAKKEEEMEATLEDEMAEREASRKELEMMEGARYSRR
ncbi:potassium channel subfamily K member 15-like [Oratosquilla oratoria]|uniref:potassium channel subfamily K member 15-like n=1 Tax=Oratosquilla oratoria TaxID=337810 RepID=UPI003F777BB5